MVKLNIGCIGVIVMECYVIIVVYCVIFNVVFGWKIGKGVIVFMGCLKLFCKEIVKNGKNFKLGLMDKKEFMRNLLFVLFNMVMMMLK